MNHKVLILTSRQNFVWTSMEEIITWIENSWVTWSKSHSVNFELINIDETSFKDIAKLAFSADKIVVTCFNIKMANVLSGLRGKLSLNIPWIFYLHGLASFGCWPLYRWEVGNLLTNKDVFVVSCNRDLNQVRVIFPDIPTFVIPFSLPLPEVIRPFKKGPVKKFAFIGRISSQKNLHSLIQAASLLSSDFELHFFGKEDNYGSPLMGMKDEHYLSFLKQLSQDLKIAHKIHFHGFMNRLDIEVMMNKEEWVFIAPSIHSDENFGMAAFRNLLNGHRVILSDWGGHADYPKFFPEQVKLVKVYQSAIGPWLSINELKRAMEEEFPDYHSNTPPEYYSEQYIQTQLEKVFHFQGENSVVRTNFLLDEIIKRREDFLQSNESDGSRIFFSYQDALKDPFFIAYAGGNFQKNEKENNQKVSWVKIQNGLISIHDPHRGHFQLPSETTEFNTLGLSFLS